MTINPTKSENPLSLVEAENYVDFQHEENTNIFYWCYKMKFDLKKPQTQQSTQGIAQWFTVESKRDNKFFFDQRKDYGLNELQ